MGQPYGSAVWRRGWRPRLPVVVLMLLLAACRESLEDPELRPPALSGSEGLVNAVVLGATSPGVEERLTTILYPRSGDRVALEELGHVRAAMASTPGRSQRLPRLGPTLRRAGGSQAASTALRLTRPRPPQAASGQRRHR